MLIWKNAALVPVWGAVDASDRGVTLGDGVFETLAFSAGVPLRLERHLARLRTGLAVLGIETDLNPDEVCKATASLGEANDISDGALRLTVLRGSGRAGVLPADLGPPTVLMSVMVTTLCDDTPLDLMIARSTRRNDLSPMSAIKSTNYGDAILARREAEAAGFDDALMLNTRGMIAEATAANVFCVINGEAVTPPVSDGALPGIMRDLVCARENIAIRSITETELKKAEEVFVTTSLSIRPVVSVDRKPVADGTPGGFWKKYRTTPLSAR